MVGVFVDNGPKCPLTPGEWQPGLQLPDATVGESYTVDISSENWNNDVAAFVEGLPDGLMEESVTRGVRVSGTPVAAGTYELELETYTGDGGTCWPTQAFSLVVLR